MSIKNLSVSQWPATPGHSGLWTLDSIVGEIRIDCLVFVRSIVKKRESLLKFAEAERRKIEDLGRLW